MVRKESSVMVNKINGNLIGNIKIVYKCGHHITKPMRLLKDCEVSKHWMSHKPVVEVELAEECKKCKNRIPFLER
jgi:hypothetical protein